MKRRIVYFGMLLLSLQACSSENPPPIVPQPQPQANGSQDDVVAAVGTDSITIKDMEPILMEGYGLNILLALVQRDLARQEATKQQIIVTDTDVAAERRTTALALIRGAQALDANGLPTSRPDDTAIDEQQAEQALDQILTQQKVTKAEFRLILETNAYLRKIAEPAVQAQLTDAALRAEFNALYGERVQVHYIVCANMTEANQVKRDLAAGKAFEDVARIRSLDVNTAPSGGELPPFTRQDNRFPEEFRQLCFVLKDGEISDPLQIKQYIYVVKMMGRLPPAHAKFEDYRDAVRSELHDRVVQASMSAMRQRLAQMALQNLDIRDPILKKQWDDKLAQTKGAVQDPTQIRQDMNKQHAIPQDQAAAATRPAATP